MALAFLVSMLVHSDPPQILTIGRPSPSLPALTFVRGDPVSRLQAGTIYVIEISGTQCVPCIQCIPKLNALQKQYRDVVFVSIYEESEPALLEFLAGPGKAIEFRVAVDTTGAVGKAWSEAACQTGIPHAFVVGKDGRVAWIGNPADLTEPLGRIVAGTFDPRQDSLRLLVEQGAVLSVRRVRERAKAGSRAYQEINEKVIAGKLEEALSDTDKALAEYQGCPETKPLLRAMRVYLLANLPDRAEEAFGLATELAIEAKADGRSVTMTNTAASLLNAAERSAPGKRDSRLIDLALPLLLDEVPVDLRGKPADSIRDRRAHALRLTGLAYHLRGDQDKAMASIREAIDTLNAIKPPAGGDEARFTDAIRQRRVAYEAVLAEYGGDKKRAR
jgi:hypothetical protein